MASPCAACKFLRRKCTNGCVFAPYFPPDQPSKFANVHKIFGASNVAKLLNELPPPQREDAVNSLAYEADSRISNPVHGCVAYITTLQEKIKEVNEQLLLARKELSSYIGPSAFPAPYFPPTPLITQNRLSTAASSTYMAGSFGLPNVGIGMDLGLGSSGSISSHPGVPFRDAVDAQQLLAMEAAMRDQNLLRFHAAIDGTRGGYDGHFNSNPAVSVQGTVELVSPQPAQIHHQHQNPQSLPQQQLFDGFFLARPPPQQQMQLPTQQQTQPQVQPQLQVYIEQMKQQQQHRKVGTDEGRSCIRPCLP
ncbi:LOB domain-containing protein 36 [Rhynchospora pubera]|uniref:LOB domain-containing protein 36 n=1 Tax=Rhynchospora pubera TaxID=906938 RepID=A0AAV8EJ42_9POAL|nr:LOB domain-containing protein 36 [Rhynchospora pubera]KAJ4804451.1 LOB domain-containing protein 36 [Rhynchospora pubera]